MSNSKGGQKPVGNFANARERDPAKSVQILMEAESNVLNWQDYEGRTVMHLGKLYLVFLLYNDLRVNIARFALSVFVSLQPWPIATTAW